MRIQKEGLPSPAALGVFTCTADMGEMGDSAQIFSVAGFWGDIAPDSPELLKALPDTFKKSTIAVAWGYSPEPRGFGRMLTPFINAGFETWVAPSVHNYRVV